MSIIAGAVDRSLGSRPAGQVSAMLRPFAGWSPDGVEIRRRPGAAIGLGRLVTTEQQKRVGADRADATIIAVVDGRIDDAEDLLAELGLAADVSDADLVAAGYLRWDVGLFSHLRGDFAVLVWDARASRLLAARDPFGVRPLFYARWGEGLLLASNPEQLLAAGVRPVPDDDAVVGYLLWRFHGFDRSFFRDIRRVPPGHVLVATDSRIVLEDYRTVPRPLNRSTSHAELDAQLRERFSTAVRRRLRSTGPCVAQLSGGLDSSAIVCVADQVMSSPAPPCPALIAAAALHPGLWCDEQPFIDAVASVVRIPVERWDGTAAIADELDDVPLALPGGRFSLIGGTEGDYALARSIGSRVLLSGTGGDQLGVPDGGLEDAIAEGRWQDAARFVFRAPGANSRSVFLTLLRTLKSMSPPWLSRAHDRMRGTPRVTKPEWLAEVAWRGWRSRTELLPAADRGGTFIRRRHWRTIVEPRHTLGIEMSQLYGMRRCLEFRFPFMDWDLVSFTLSLPSLYWPPPWPGERVHRRPLRHLLPKAIVDRRTKAEFSPALANRVRRQLPTIRARFMSRSWHAGPYVDQRDARAVLETFASSENPSFAETWAVWGIAAVEAWLEKVSRYTRPPTVEA